MGKWKRINKGGWHTTADRRELDEDAISAMLEERTAAKAAKNYKEADSLARQLQAQVRRKARRSLFVCARWTHCNGCCACLCIPMV